MQDKLLSRLEQLEQRSQKGEGIEISFIDIDAQGNRSKPRLYMSVKNGEVKFHDQGDSNGKIKQ